MRVLIADADADFAQEARLALRSDALIVDVTTNAGETLDAAVATPYAAIVLDLALPGGADRKLIERLRRHGVASPVLALTRDPRPAARVAALQSGAEDCLVKPVILPEFTARVHALARRAARTSGQCLELEDLVLHCGERRAFRSGKALPLTEREFLALEILARAHGQPVPAGELLARLWHAKSAPRDNFIAVLMMRLRKKVDDGHAVKLIHTQRGSGYSAGVMPASPASQD